MKWKIFAFLFGFCLLLLAILWLAQTVFLTDFYRVFRVRDIRSSANVIVYHLENDDIYNIVMRLSEDGNFSANIVNADGESLLSRGLTRNQSIAMAHIPAARENGGEFHEFFETRSKISGELQENLAYIRIEGDWAIIINATVSPLVTTVTTLRYQLYMVSGVMLLMSVILAVIIQKVAASESKKNEALRRELLANVSHDLRTPLSLIFGYAEMMKDFPTDIGAEQIDIIMDETKRLTTLVNDILDISKLEAGMEQINSAEFNITENIRDAVNRMNELLRNRNYDITFTYDTDIFIEADEIKIGCAFYNLLVNAVNYSGDDRKISLMQTTTEEYVKISVTDSGAGIPQEEMPFIWDRYYKSGKTHKRAVTGTGLGLSIVKKIIELHNGRYGVTSEIGKGSTFWMELKANTD
ncbi:MAG: HAMP domain-containing histidine kinase [Defluviitaleaceae bacterium]|nr:HAMP domain-containing histidine kinase [Defluviitaleaceae bacterium]MCL2262283.1 HAMP domain-containing histidine kinase [Defluviitaleaceae bacterium]